MKWLRSLKRSLRSARSNFEKQKCKSALTYNGRPSHGVGFIPHTPHQNSNVLAMRGLILDTHNCQTRSFLEVRLESDECRKAALLAFNISSARTRTLLWTLSATKNHSDVTNSFAKLKTAVHCVETNCFNICVHYSLMSTSRVKNAPFTNIFSVNCKICNRTIYISQHAEKANVYETLGRKAVLGVRVSLATLWRRVLFRNIPSQHFTPGGGGGADNRPAAWLLLE